jgi:hypothetical protein
MSFRQTLIDSITFRPWLMLGKGKTSLSRYPTYAASLDASSKAWYNNCTTTSFNVCDSTYSSGLRPLYDCITQAPEKRPSIDLVIQDVACIPSGNFK